MALHWAASMYSSSSNPNLHRKYLNVGSNGRISLGIRQAILSLSYSRIFIGAILDCTVAIRLDTKSSNGDFLFVNLLIVRPKWIIGLLQAPS